jgi:class 3 adenylate cyclase
MSRYFERMSRVLESHGGRVEKFIGDAVMAVFRIPTLHEDDAPGP